MSTATIVLYSSIGAARHAIPPAASKQQADAATQARPSSEATMCEATCLGDVESNVRLRHLPLGRLVHQRTEQRQPKPQSAHVLSHRVLLQRKRRTCSHGNAVHWMRSGRTRRHRNIPSQTQGNRRSAVMCESAPQRTRVAGEEYSVRTGALGVTWKQW